MSTLFLNAHSRFDCSFHNAHSYETKIASGQYQCMSTILRSQQQHRWTARSTYIYASMDMLYKWAVKKEFLLVLLLLRFTVFRCIHTLDVCHNEKYECLCVCEQTQRIMNETERQTISNNNNNNNNKTTTTAGI